MTKQTPSKLEVAQFELVTNIEKTFTELLPLASKNVGMPFETPLRWFEGYYQGENTPHELAVWATLEDRAKNLSITRQYDTRHNTAGVLWGVSYDEPTDEVEGAVAVMSDFTTYTARDPAFGKTYWTRLRPTLGHVTGNSEYWFTMSEEQKIDLLGSISASIDTFREQAPAAHAQYMEDNNLHVSSRAFAQIGSRASQEFFATLAS